MTVRPSKHVRKHGFPDSLDRLSGFCFYTHVQVLESTHHPDRSDSEGSESTIQNPPPVPWLAMFHFHRKRSFDESLPGSIRRFHRRAALDIQRLHLPTCQGGRPSIKVAHIESYDVFFTRKSNKPGPGPVFDWSTFCGQFLTVPFNLRKKQ